MKIKNIYKDPKTTLIALLVFIVTSAFVFLGKSTFSEVWPAWSFVIYFAFADHRNIKPPKAPMFALLVLLVVGCSPQKRLARLVKKNPELIQKHSDTVRIDTFVVIAPVKEDFVLPIIIDDTMHIEGSTFSLDFYFEEDSIYLDVKSIPDTVFIEIEKTIDFSNIEVNQVTEDKHNFISDTKLIIGMILGILFLILIIKLTK